ncbi:AMP-binding protein [Guyparkeria hydrothermalis]|uniref:AMP-binding protein n=1 Tax=Guyparkeria hydrothermalis TaxID=923 RepID=UPI002020D93E|nr:AMP-binding protein [Guyparkeria hydrothermalis]MCL7750426.1 AMP-binding protein [Guyparkeria hydrothermalis]
MPIALISTIDRQARDRPRARALGDRHQWLDYAELAGRLQAARATLRGLDLAAGDRVVLWAGKAIDTVVWLLAMLAEDIVPAPAHPGLKPEQVDHQLARCEARGLLADRARLRSYGQSAFEADWGWWATGVDAPQGLPSPDANGAVGLPPRETGRFPDRLAMLFFTSGSTGLPKGVMVSEGNLDAGTAVVADYLGLREDDVIAAMLPLAFDYGFSQVTTGLSVGAAVYLDDYLLPADLKRPLLREQVTVFAGTPGLLVPLSRQSWLSEAPALRVLTNSGGALPTAAVRRVREARPATQLFLMYGLTEAFRATFLPPDEVDAHPDSIGYPLPGTTIGLVDADGRLLGAGETGELVQGGPLVTRGYINDPEASAQRFRAPPTGWPDETAERVVFSGDRVRMDNAGRLYFAGRLDEQIKVAGFRISPEEIESVAHAAAGIDEAVAVGVSDPESGNQRLVLHVAPDRADIEALRHHLRVHLAPYQQPAAIVAHAALPRSANGKFDRQALLDTTGNTGNADNTRERH